MADEAPAPLQFDKAELPAQGAMTCAACQGRIVDAYWDVNGNTACARCKQLLAGGRTRDPLALAKATGLGLGASAVGAAGWWAIREASGWEIGLVAIGVGWLVGRAVHKGSGGLGGPLYQALAVGLTYLAVMGTYVPDVYTALSGPDAGHAPLASLLPAIAFILLKAPFSSGGPLGILIVGFGLWQAFRMNGKVALQITGPYQLGVAPRPPGA